MPCPCTWDCFQFIAVKLSNFRSFFPKTWKLKNFFSDASPLVWVFEPKYRMSFPFFIIHFQRFLLNCKKKKTKLTLSKNPADTVFMSRRNIDSHLNVAFFIVGAFKTVLRLISRFRMSHGLLLNSLLCIALTYPG